MRKASTLQCSLWRFGVSLLLVASFICASSVMATTEVSGNEVDTDGKLVNEEPAKTSLQGYDEEEKFKGLFPKSIPIVKPIPKLVKPIPIPVYKPIPKPIPLVKPISKPIPIIKSISNEEEKFKGLPKPIPVIKPIPKLIPVVKPIPVPIYKPTPKLIPIIKPIPIVKPVPKPIPIVKPVPKPFTVQKPIPAIDPESFLKPKPFFEKPIPKLPLDPKFKKPLLPPFPIQKPISSP
ncbi:proline-rich protein 4-like [Glycine soja]|uniref:Zinc finger protein 512B n=1 Tax=Glycine soja TaxID=3848 RepID=A0A445GXP2_GLYSO|nr:proline-rich protein 4-like [Glycine soja]KAG4947410.1 hypothetical protein JHK87_043417 [Glycine soja]RZB66012.1 hypothetical protein D0Y65_041887 [Glycine soja]